MNITVQLETITPEIAREWLEKNIGNRPPSIPHAKSLAADMTAGRWKVNGDTIRLAGERIVDGQHRLMAVCMSGITIQTFVARGVAPEVFDTIDMGKRRTTADTLGCLGFKNTTRLAAMLVMIDRYVTSRLNRSVTYSNMDIEILSEKYAGASSMICNADKVRVKGLVHPSVVDACRYLFSQKDHDAACEFMDKVLRGRGIEQSDPEYLLRERIIANSLAKSKLSREYLMILFIKAWNARRSNVAMKTLRHIEGHDVPVII